MTKNMNDLALGITLQGVEPPAIFRQQVRDVAAGRFTHLWVTDSSLHARYVYAYLTLAAVESDNIMLATGVTHPYTRHPAMTANAIATLHEISGGRAILGMGAGDRPTAELGFQPARLADLRSSIQVIRKLLAGEKVNHHSPCFELTDGELHFDFNERVPIFMAASGPKMLALAGEVADGVLAQVGIFPEAIKFARECVAEGAARAGRSIDEIDLWLMACGSVSEDDADGLNGSRTMAAWFAKVAPHCCHIAGLDEAVVSDIQSAYRGGEFHLARDAARLVPDDMVKLFTVGGAPAQIRERLTPLLDLGIAGINFMPIGPQRAASAARFNREVAGPLGLGKRDG